MRKSIFISHFECTVCGGKFTIPRRKERRREKGHIKTMYCPYCKKTRDFVERGEW